MKHIHHLKARWLVATMLTAIVASETAAWYVCQTFNLHFPATAVGALSVGLVAVAVSVLYDGED
jgi:hypothetical protein